MGGCSLRIGWCSSALRLFGPPHASCLVHQTNLRTWGDMPDHALFCEHVSCFTSDLGKRVRGALATALSKFDPRFPPFMCILVLSRVQRSDQNSNFAEAMWADAVSAIMPPAKVVVTGEMPDDDTQAIVIANHQARNYYNVIILLAAIIRSTRLK